MGQVMVPVVTEGLRVELPDVDPVSCIDELLARPLLLVVRVESFGSITSTQSECVLGGHDVVGLLHAEQLDGKIAQCVVVPVWLWGHQLHHSVLLVNLERVADHGEDRIAEAVHLLPVEIERAVDVLAEMSRYVAGVHVGGGVQVAHDGDRRQARAVWLIYIKLINSTPEYLCKTKVAKVLPGSDDLPARRYRWHRYGARTPARPSTATPSADA